MTCAIADAIASVPIAVLDDLSREVWQAHAAGRLDDDQAQALAEAIQARRTARAATRAGQGGPVQLGRVASIFPPKPRRQRPTDRTQSVERRRTIAASSPLPPHLAARFTTGQLAALGIIADELAARGGASCRSPRSQPAPASRTGSRKRPYGSPRPTGLVVTERPQPGRKHQTNLVRCISREWGAWLAKRRSIGCKSLHPTDNKGFSSKWKRHINNRKPNCRKEEEAFLSGLRTEPQSRRKKPSSRLYISASH